VRLVVLEGVALAATGVAAGAAGALALSRLLTGMLYGVRPGDPTTFLAVSVLLSVVAVAATYIPARRAAKVDPMVALRYE
jgi:putative ABC transport system permease protein